MPLTRANGVVTCPGITPQIKRLPINGMLTDLMTYNGSFPGPLVRLKRGEQWSMKFTNGLPKDGSKNIIGFTRGVTNIHTHGWHVSPSGTMDDVMRQFWPAGTGKRPATTSTTRRCSPAAPSAGITRTSTASRPSRSGAGFTARWSWRTRSTPL